MSHPQSVENATTQLTDQQLEAMSAKQLIAVIKQQQEDANHCEQQLKKLQNELNACIMVAGVEVEPQPEAEEAQVCFPEEVVNKITGALEQKNVLLEDYKNRALRLQADFDNFRRRTRQEREELGDIISEGLLKEFLPIVDNFARALSADALSDQGMRTGVEMIFRQLMSVMDKIGVKAIETEGQHFDPAQHEAIMRVVDENLPEETIVEELQKGYQYKNRILRPSMVKVSSKS